MKPLTPSVLNLLYIKAKKITFLAIMFFLVFPSNAVAQIEYDHNEVSEKIDLVVDRTSQFDLDRWYWNEAVAINGLTAIYFQNSHPQALGTVQSKIDALINAPVPSDPEYGLTYAPPDQSHVMQLNDLPMGVSSLALFDLTQDNSYFTPAQASAQAALNWDLTASNGAFLHWNSTGYAETTHPYKDWVWVDSIYMLVPLMTEMYTQTGNQEYLDVASEQVILHADLLQDPSSGLIYHGWDETQGTNGIIWGRGSGWFYAGTIDLISSMPASHPDRPEIVEIFRKQSEGLKNTQNAEGIWNQIVDDENSWTESTGSSAFCYGFLKGLRLNLLDSASYIHPAQQCSETLLDKTRSDGSIEDASAGAEVNVDPSYYDTIDHTGTYPFAQGLYLLFLSELIQSGPVQHLPDTGKGLELQYIFMTFSIACSLFLFFKKRKAEREIMKSD